MTLNVFISFHIHDNGAGLGLHNGALALVPTYTNLSLVPYDCVCLLSLFNDINMFHIPYIRVSLTRFNSAHSQPW